MGCPACTPIETDVGWAQTAIPERKMSAGKREFLMRSTIKDHCPLWAGSKDQVGAPGLAFETWDTRASGRSGRQFARVGMFPLDLGQRVLEDVESHRGFVLVHHQRRAEAKRGLAASQNHEP